MLVGAELKYRR